MAIRGVQWLACSALVVNEWSLEAAGGRPTASITLLTREQDVLNTA